MFHIEKKLHRWSKQRDARPGEVKHYLSSVARKRNYRRVCPSVRKCVGCIFISLFSFWPTNGEYLGLYPALLDVRELHLIRISRLSRGNSRLSVSPSQFSARSCVCVYVRMSICVSVCPFFSLDSIFPKSRERQIEFSQGVERAVKDGEG